MKNVVTLVCDAKYINTLQEMYAGKFSHKLDQYIPHFSKNNISTNVECWSHYKYSAITQGC